MPFAWLVLCRAEELAAPYYTFKVVDDKSVFGLACLLWRPLTPSSLTAHAMQKADKTVILASPKGGEIPLDPASLQGEFLTETADKFLKDGEEQSRVLCKCAMRTCHNCNLPVRRRGSEAVEELQASHDPLSTRL